MLYCRKCKAEVLGDKRCCPLCQGKLVGEREPDTEVFPFIPHEERSAFLVRVITFTLIMIAVLSCAINGMVPTRTSWAGFVVVGCVCAWITSMVGIMKKGNILKCIVQLEIICLPLGIFWDYFTGWRDWSLNFYYPAVCVMVMATIIILATALKYEPSSYILYLMISAVLGLGSMIFVLAGAVEYEIAPIICSAISAIVLAGIMLFQWRNFRTEASKKFHL